MSKNKSPQRALLYNIGTGKIERRNLLLNKADATHSVFKNHSNMSVTMKTQRSTSFQTMLPIARSQSLSFLSVTMCLSVSLLSSPLPSPTLSTSHIVVGIFVRMCFICLINKVSLQSSCITTKSPGTAGMYHCVKFIPPIASICKKYVKENIFLVLKSQHQP